MLRRWINSWFPFGGHLIAGLYRTARSIESTARQRESLVRLGTLAAGLAHEINNPASAATRAVGVLETACQALLSSVRELADDEISSGQFAAIDALRREVEPRSAEPDPLVRADLEQALSTWLTRHGIAREWTIAPALAAAGVDLAWCTRAATALEGSALQPGLEWVANSFTVATLLSELKDSTQRISELVAAVRSYSQMDRTSMQEIDVADGLDSTLVMLGHKLRDGVTVVRDYGADVPRIDAYAGVEPGVDQPDRQRRRCNARHRHPAGDDAGRAGQRRRRDQRHRSRNVAAGGGSRVRRLLHDEGGGQEPRPRPRHRAAHRGGAPRWHDHHRLATRQNRAAGANSHPATLISSGKATIDWLENGHRDRSTCTSCVLLDAGYLHEHDVVHIASRSAPSSSRGRT